MRDSYVALLPLTFLGVLATLVQYLPLPGLHATVAQLLGPDAQSTTGQLLKASEGLFGMALAATLSIHLSQRLVGHGADRPSAVWLGLAALINVMLWKMVSANDAAAQVDLHSTVLGLTLGTWTPWIVTRLYQWRSLPALRIPYESEFVFLQATRMTTPLIATSLLTLALAHAWVAAEAIITPWVSEMAAWLLTELPSGGLKTAGLVLFTQALWAIGIHGDNIVDTWLPPRFSAAAQSFDPSLVWRPLIDNFVHLGGSGATLGLVIALLWVARDGPQRRIAQVSLVPTVFNVNELLLFGLPVVLRPHYLLPFILLPVGLALVGWWLLQAGVLPQQATTLHWTTPALLSGWLLTGSWRGVAWQLVVICLSTLCYLPAVRRTEAERRLRQQDVLKQAGQAIIGARQQHRPALARRDQAGEVARGLLADLKAAIGTDAIHLVYQSKHRADGRAIGAEALVRWTHPRYEAVRADVIVTLAEDGGLAEELGQWVIEQACASKARWNLAGLRATTLAVNVSPLQLDRIGFANEVLGRLQAHGLHGNEIELEITESHALPLGPVLEENMAVLTRHGVRLAMDDFGMGHSSLRHLRHFHVDAIKIDGSLSREVPASEAACDIVRSIAALGRSQRIDVVAEFVETATQRDALAALGCTLFQGYLHNPPLPEALCIESLRHNLGVVAPEAARPAVAERQPA